MTTSNMNKDMQHDIGRFSEWSRTYEQSRLQGLIFDRAHEEVLKLIASACGEEGPESILDVGCGTGRLLRKAGARWPQARLIGVDPAEGMIEVARQLTPGPTFYVGAAEALPLPDNSVKVAVSTLSFHHWSDPQAGVREVARVLSPGGRFILIDAAPPDWLWKIVRRLNPYHPRIARAHNPTSRQTLFAWAGLHVEMQRSTVWRYVYATVGVKPFQS